jgi:uncharacterized ion transporter superfamily protein YfcC
MLVAGTLLWIAWTMRYAARNPIERRAQPARGGELPIRHLVIFGMMMAAMGAYVYGALSLGWGFNELSGVFIVAALLSGLVGRLGLVRTVTTYMEGMLGLLPAAMMVALARTISLVLTDGRVVDTILNALVSAVATMPGTAAALLMVPFHALIHIAVPSVSGQAVLTMPLFVPLADVLGFSRQVPVLAYQTGAGLMEMATPTNGALMAVLLAAGVSLQRWLRFALGGLVLLVVVGVIGIVLARQA